MEHSSDNYIRETPDNLDLDLNIPHTDSVDDLELSQIESENNSLHGPTSSQSHHSEVLVEPNRTPSATRFGDETTALTEFVLSGPQVPRRVDRATSPIQEFVQEDKLREKARQDREQTLARSLEKDINEPLTEEEEIELGKLILRKLAQSKHKNIITVEIDGEVIYLKRVFKSLERDQKLPSEPRKPGSSSLWRDRRGRLLSVPKRK